MNDLLSPDSLNRLADAIDRYAYEELVRLHGLHEFPEDRSHLLDRERLRRVFAKHGLSPEQFGLDVEQPDETLIPQLRIVQADIGILAELNGTSR